MKLNYRDKVVLGILLAIVILLAGFFALIKPKMKEIKENKARLEKLEEEKEKIEAQIAEIPGLKEAITKLYQETNKEVKLFVEPEKIENARLMDQYMQKFVENNELRITSVSCSDISTSSIGFYYFTKTFAGEDILSMADLNGERIADHRKQQAEQNALSSRSSENVLGSTYNVTVKGEKEKIWDFLSEIEEQDKAIIINSVSYTNVSITDEEDETANMSEEDKEKNMPTASFNISVYSLYELSEPDLN